MSRYHLVTVWRFGAGIDEVGAILADVERLTEWWPAVYLDVRVISPGDESGLGKEVELFTKGWLPYTLRWSFRVTEVGEHRVALTPLGDFTGRGEWTFAQDGPTAVVRYDWNVEARKPILRALTWLFRPVFTANHDWAMRKGEESLRLELARRAATTEEQRSRIPPPPGPSFLTFGAARRREAPARRAGATSRQDGSA